VRRHFQSLGMMLEVATRASRKLRGKLSGLREEGTSGIAPPAQICRCRCDRNPPRV